jgi:hypothetical protein
VFCKDFFYYYCHEHYHSRLGLHTPASVHFGTAETIRRPRPGPRRRAGLAARVPFSFFDPTLPTLTNPDGGTQPMCRRGRWSNANLADRRERRAHRREGRRARWVASGTRSCVSGRRAELACLYGPQLGQESLKPGMSRDGQTPPARPTARPDCMSSQLPRIKHTAISHGERLRHRHSDGRFMCRTHRVDRIGTMIGVRL